MSNLLLGIGLIIAVVYLGQVNAKIGLSLAALILLGSIIVNKDRFLKIMNGEAI